MRCASVLLDYDISKKFPPAARRTCTTRFPPRTCNPSCSGALARGPLSARGRTIQRCKAYQWRAKFSSFVTVLAASTFANVYVHDVSRISTRSQAKQIVLAFVSHPATAAATIASRSASAVASCSVSAAACCSAAAARSDAFAAATMLFGL